MDFATSFFVFVFGAIVGSFLNVVIFRYNTGRSVVTGRSACMSCARQLEWYNMLPLLSFTIQKGRCSNCFSKISRQYFIVELLSALSTLALYFKLGLTDWLPFYVVVFSILIVISVYDLRHLIIPNGLAYLLASIAFIRLLYIYLYISSEVAISGLESGIIAFLFLGSFWLVSSGRWMGLGDAKLVLGLGWLNNLCFGLTSLILSFWIGAVIGVLANLLVKRVREIPFAPFLIVGFTLVFFFKFNIFYYLGDMFCLSNLL
ncbi:MAG: prepilin peptidase [Candidatus Vogelbacteria bacterium]|nr:prepilin peptidase [Candidatus Vogelbacteria bacterium]